jgi:pilus assembly protein CpaF
MPSMATLHANSAREAVTKLCTLPLLAGQNIPGDFVVPTVAGSVDLVVQVATLANGRRVVREIAALSGRAEQGVIEIAEIYTDRGAGLERRGGFPPHPERFERAGIDLAQVLNDHPTRQQVA